jgi:hypothetical protein
MARTVGGGRAVRRFIESVKARVLCLDFLVRTFGISPAGLLPDGELTLAWSQNSELLRAIREVKQGTPAGKSGGGRRLNVLVTRAREMIHVITSIPRSEYAALPPVTEGQVPGGRWLLYAYLHFVEELERQFAVHIQRDDTPPATPAVRTDDAPHRSPVALGVARQLADVGGLGSEVPWGNAGFCVDIAVQHPRRAGAVTVGVLCDFNRYAHAEDAVEWELFRTTVVAATSATPAAAAAREGRAAGTE